MLLGELLALLGELSVLLVSEGKLEEVGASVEL